MCAVRVSLDLGEIGKLSMANDPVLAKIRDRMLMMATAQGAHGKLSTGVRWWIKYCVYGRRTCPVRSVDEHSARALKLLEEELVMDFVIWLVACKPSALAGLSPSTRHLSTCPRFKAGSRASRLGAGGSVVECA